MVQYLAREQVLQVISLPHCFLSLSGLSPVKVKMPKKKKVTLQLINGTNVSSFAVAHAQETHHHSTDKPLIQCYKCGEPCKGEVLRVQNKHFHLKCFTCKGSVLLHSGLL